MLVRDVLRSKGGRVITMDPKSTVREAIGRMVQHNIGSLPIVDADGNLVGIFSERDVLRQVNSREEGLDQVSLDEVMTREPITCDADDDVDTVMGKMSERRIAKVPVLSSGQLIGVISVGDMIKLMYERVRSENHHLMSYIHGTY